MKLKYAIFYVLAFLFFALGLFAQYWWENDDRDQLFVIEELEQKIAQEEAAIAEAKASALSDNSGLSEERLAFDREIIESKIFRRLFVWQDYEGYMKARDTLYSFGLDDSHPLLKDFFPDISKNNFDGENMGYDGMKPVLLSIDNGIYKYATIVNVRGRAGRHGGSSTGEILFQYGIDSDGLISLYSAYVITDK